MLLHHFPALHPSTTAEPSDPLLPRPTKPSSFNETQWIGLQQCCGENPCSALVIGLPWTVPESHTAPPFSSTSSQHNCRTIRLAAATPHQAFLLQQNLVDQSETVQWRESLQHFGDGFALDSHRVPCCSTIFQHFIPAQLQNPQTQLPPRPTKPSSFNETWWIGLQQCCGENPCSALVIGLPWTVPESHTAPPFSSTSSQHNCRTLRLAAATPHQAFLLQ